MNTFMSKSHRGLRSATLTAMVLAAMCILILFVSCNNPITGGISLTLNPATLKLGVGESSPLTATVSPDRAITWSSSNTKVATVDDGTVTAVADGIAIITVRAAGGKTATCTVTAGDGGGDQQLDVSGLSGTWIATNISYTSITFSGNTFMLMSYTSVGFKGTVSGNTLISTEGVWHSYTNGIGTATVSGDTLTISGFTGSGRGYINGSYTKQSQIP